MSNAIVPRGDKTHSLGTSKKRWNEVHSSAVYTENIEAETVGGKLADLINDKASNAALADVKGSMNMADAPCFYSRSERFKATGQTELTTPNILWVNISDRGYKTNTPQVFDISQPESWDTKATLYQTNTTYNIDDYVYINDATDTYLYKATTEGLTSTLTNTFPEKVGETFTDNAVIWECVLNYANGKNRAGKDFYIYACQNEDKTSIEPVYILTANSTVPLGYNADNSRKIGGFHCECADIGNTGDTNHPLNNYMVGDILPNSVWDLSHRPISEPEGMCYVDGLDKWFDIYLDSWNGSKLVSSYGGTIADGGSSPTWHGEKFIEQLGLQKKRLMWRDEFTVLAKGSNELTAIKGAADPSTTGGHVDTAGRRTVSYYGHEDCCGVLWQWCRDTFEYSPSYTWSTDSVYNASVDAKQYGSAAGSLRRALVGGYWIPSSYCGSRSFGGSSVSASVSANIAARGASEPFKFSF